MPTMPVNKPKSLILMLNERPGLVRVRPGKPYDGRPTWVGQFRTDAGSRWRPVRNGHGLTIIYTTPDYALAAARLQVAPEARI